MSITEFLGKVYRTMLAGKIELKFIVDHFLKDTFTLCFKVHISPADIIQSLKIIPRNQVPLSRKHDNFPSSTHFYSGRVASCSFAIHPHPICFTKMFPFLGKLNLLPRESTLEWKKHRKHHHGNFRPKLPRNGVSSPLLLSWKLLSNFNFKYKLKKSKVVVREKFLSSVSVKIRAGRRNLAVFFSEQDQTLATLPSRVAIVVYF